MSNIATLVICCCLCALTGLRIFTKCKFPPAPENNCCIFFFCTPLLLKTLEHWIWKRHPNHGTQFCFVFVSVGVAMSLTPQARQMWKHRAPHNSSVPMPIPDGRSRLLTEGSLHKLELFIVIIIYDVNKQTPHKLHTASWRQCYSSRLLSFCWRSVVVIIHIHCNGTQPCVLLYACFLRTLVLATQNRKLTENTHPQFLALC